MPSNPETIIQDIQVEFDNLLDFVTGDEAHTAQIYAIERGLLKRLLALGRELLALFLAVRARAIDHTPVLDEQGNALAYHSDKRRSYLSIFGLIDFARPYFYARAAGSADIISACADRSASPLDAELGLPLDRYSDLVREMSESLAVEVPYAKTASFFERFFGLALSSRVLAEMIEADACDVMAFYQDKPAPPPDEEGVLLVLQADGKGVPLVRDAQGRLQKKEAIVTGLYTSDLRVRSAESVVASFYEKDKETDTCAQEEAGAKSSVRPQQKQLWATLAGKDAALDRLRVQVARRQGAHIQAQVALCDGDPALQRRIEARFPTFALVLDFVHVSQYLWQAAEVLFDEGAQRQDWVEQQALQLLGGSSQAVLEQVESQAEACRSWRRQKLRQVAGYFRRNLDRMHYDRYLARGWPIATGVIEGACRHLVKDRCEGTGMRWTKPGAESLLGLRSVYVNGDWEGYHGFHRQRAYRRRYGQTAPIHDLAEEQALKWAA